MSPDREEFLPFRVASLERRIEKIESLQPEIVAYEVKNLVTELRSLKKQLIITSLSVASGSVIFFISVFQVLK